MLRHASAADTALSSEGIMPLGLSWPQPAGRRLVGGGTTVASMANTQLRFVTVDALRKPYFLHMTLIINCMVFLAPYFSCVSCSSRCKHTYRGDITPICLHRCIGTILFAFSTFPASAVLAVHHGAITASCSSRCNHC